MSQLKKCTCLGIFLCYCCCCCCCICYKTPQWKLEKKLLETFMKYLFQEKSWTPVNNITIIIRLLFSSNYNLFGNCNTIGYFFSNFGKKRCWKCGIFYRNRRCLISKHVVLMYSSMKSSLKCHMQFIQTNILYTCVQHDNMKLF